MKRFVHGLTITLASVLLLSGLALIAVGGIYNLAAKFSVASQRPADDSPDAVGGYTAIVDEKGQLISPTALDVKPLIPPTGVSTRDLVLQAAPGGGLMVDTSDYQMHTVATKNPDGTISIQCLPGPAAKGTDSQQDNHNH